MVAEQPDLTLDEIVAAMRKRRIPGSRTAVWRFFARHDLTFKKKSLRAAEQQRPDVARARRPWRREPFMFELAPALDRGDIVFMDSLQTHKVAGVTEAIEAVDAMAIYLSAYSPDLNPIEQVFSKLNALLRKAAELSPVLHYNPSRGDRVGGNF